MNRSRRKTFKSLMAGLTALLVLAQIAVAPGKASAQAYPSRPISWIVPFPPGGVTDSTSRVVAKRMAEILGTSIVVENRPGAGGMLGVEMGARAAPDGYTIMYVSQGPISSNKHLYKNVRYDPLKDFTYVHGMFMSPMVLVVPAGSPFKTLAELVDFARRNPGKLNYGSAGAGTAPHVNMEMLLIAAGIKITHVPYKGSGPALVDLLAGRLDLALDYPSQVLPHLQGGNPRLRTLVAMGPKRFDFIPEVPAVGEAGYPAASAAAWSGIAVPPGTPAAIVSRLSAAMREALADPAVVGPYEKLGTFTLGHLPEEKFRAFVADDYARMGEVIRRVGITLD